MKRILIIVVTFLVLQSCAIRKCNYNHKFAHGELVLVGDKLCTVQFVMKDGRYYLKPIDCKSRYCDIMVCEEFISKYNKTE